MTAARNAQAKAARLASGRRPAVLSDGDEGQSTPPAGGVPSRAERTETVKTSLHLAPELHRQLVSWCNEAARELGRSRVPGTEPLRVLVRRLLTDDQLAAEVIEALRHEGGN